MNRLLLVVYRLLTSLLTPLLALVLLLRLLAGKEDGRRIGERLGLSRQPRPSGRLVWIHAASVGELASLLPLLRQLRAPSGPPVLLTTVTRTAAQLAADRLPAGVIHQYVPVDHWLAFALFRRHWRPHLGVLAEAELWPEIVHAMPRLHLINARMSERSLRRHLRLRWYAAWLLSRCHLCLAQSVADAERFRRLGAAGVEAAGSTKRDAEPLRVNGAIVARLQAVFRGRPVLLLASSHAGEEARLLAALPRLRRHQAGLALLLVPRHPARAAEVQALAQRQGLASLRWSALGQLDPPPALDAVVVDLIGEMGACIQVSRLVLMGGSLGVSGRAIGGHNPLEPVRLGRPVLCGPDMANFAELSAELACSGWLRSAATLEQLWQELATHPAWRSPPSAAPPPLTGPSGRIATAIRRELGLQTGDQPAAGTV